MRKQFNHCRNKLSKRTVRTKAVVANPKDIVFGDSSKFEAPVCEIWDHVSSSNYQVIEIKHLKPDSMKPQKGMAGKWLADFLADFLQGEFLEPDHTLCCTLRGLSMACFNLWLGITCVLTASQRMDDFLWEAPHFTTSKRCPKCWSVGIYYWPSPDLESEQIFRNRWERFQHCFLKKRRKW